MKRIGITGGVGSGKSVISELLKISGIAIYNSDIEAKKLMNNSPVLRRKITQLLGEMSYENEQLNRSYVARAVFGDSELLKKLNDIVHPEVRKDFLQWTSTQQCEIVGVESAILFESELSQLLDKVIVVAAPIELRIQRVAQRDGLSESEIRQRIAAQMDDETRECLADYVVQNDDLHPIIPQINEILIELSTS